MKGIRIAVALLVTLAGTSALAKSDAQKSFDQLKTMEGIWEGKTDAGQPVKVTYHVVSGGLTVMSEASEDSMVTMYYLDGDRLLMTHFCGAGNKPRMVGKMSPDGKTLDFSYLDATCIMPILRSPMGIITANNGRSHRTEKKRPNIFHYSENSDQACGALWPHLIFDQLLDRP
jgi:hypothetical protein